MVAMAATASSWTLLFTPSPTRAPISSVSWRFSSFLPAAPLIFPRLRRPTKSSVVFATMVDAKPTVLVAEKLGEAGLNLLKSFANVDCSYNLSPEELYTKISLCDALIVRSGTKVTREVFEYSGGRLKVVGRAGVGIDNVDLSAATEHGCLVVNAPTANTIAAAEHGIALLTAMARNIAQADASVKAGKWQRNKYVGVSLVGKTLAVMGFGKVGSEVARRAKGLGMHVITHDPYAPADRARAIGVDLLTFDEAISSADFISLHMPLTPTTLKMFNDEAFSKMKRGVRIVNVARGGVIDEEALLRALNAGIVAQAALDVFTEEPPPKDSKLVLHENVTVTPHLGASTMEAQEGVALEIAEAVIGALKGELAATAVNAPMVPAEVLSELAPFVALAEKLSRLAVQLVAGGSGIRSVKVCYASARSPDDLDTRLLRAMITKGLIEPLSSVFAATYLKNFTRRNIEGVATNSNISKEFKNQLMRDLLRIEPAVLKVLLEVLRVIVDSEFVKQNSWPELVPELQSAIQSSNLSNNGSNLEWNTVNALMVLHAVIRPFQYFLDPKVAKEPVPPQLELIAKEILVPLLTVLHHLVEKALAARGSMELEMEKVLLIICKCVYFAVRSHMPSALAPLLPSFCRNLIAILGSLNFDCGLTPENGYLLRLKTGKRSLLIFCALVTRHRKYSDKLTPDIINCALKIANYSSKISKLHFLSERIVSLALDMVSHVLETGRGWRLVSPHFSYLLDSAIFPALMLNEKDISDWEEDAAEYIRKNLPSELEEISGWREDLFTVRKSAINLLGIISVSKGPPVATSIYGSSVTSKRKKGERNRRNDQRASMGELLVLPFLSKFPNPSHINRLEARIFIDYFGVLMAYGGLQDFLREQNPGYTTTLIRTRVLPLYDLPECPPYLVASANWVLGELASCLPEEMNVDVYTSLLKALAMPDNEGCSCFPVRVSAAGAITALLENEYSPPEWLPLLQVVIGRIGNDDDQNIILFRLLSSIVEAGNENVAVHIPYVVSSLVHAISKCMHPSLDPWPEVVEKGFEALAVMSETWQNSKPEEVEQNKSSEMWARGQAVIAKALSALLQQAWLTPVQSVGGEVAYPSSCIDQPSTLLHCIMLSVTNCGMIVELKLSELLLAWADLIADWHAWEESEDLSIFDCIKEVVNLHGKYGLKNFIVRQMPSPPAPPVSQRSIIEGLSTFVSEAILKYPSATWRACSCIHILLHVPSYSFETDVKQALVVIFCHAAFSRFREICDKPCPLWKPLLLAVSSCYLCCPDVVEKILEENGGFAVWVSSLASLCTSTFEPGLSMASETKLVVMTLVKVVEHLLGPRITGGGLLRDCFISLMEASVRLKEVQNQMEDEGVTEDGENDDEEDEDEDDAEDSESDEREETEEEFLERYAKAAVALENGMDIEEGDLEDQEHEIELGSLAEADQERVVLSLMERYHHVLIQGHALPAELISSFVHAFPGYSLFFAPSC